MKTNRTSGVLALIALAAMSAWAHGAEPQSKPAPLPTGGALSAALADDEKLIAELSRLDLVTLRDYMFEKNKVRPEDRAAYMAVSALKQLGDAKLSRRQQQELVNSVALGIDKVLKTINDPEQLMKLNTQLVINGTARPLNILEYFGESPKTQAQLRPIAEAIAR